jgi:hypothetical protein
MIPPKKNLGKKTILIGTFFLVDQIEANKQFIFYDLD